jgi:hypothetical protein
MKNAILTPSAPFWLEEWSGGRWLLFWLFWSLVISILYWGLGPYSYLRIQDTTDFNLPYRMAAARDFLSYGITYWQPKFSGGIPAWVMPQFDSFLINGLPYHLLPPWAAYGFVMWLQRFIAGYFTYRLCRSLGLGNTASLFAGLAFSLNQWSSAGWTLYDGLGAPATPFYLFIFGKFYNHHSKIIGLTLVALLGLFLGLVASSALYTIFLIAALPVWFLLVERFSFTQSWPYFLAFILGAVVAEAPAVIALLTFVSESSRGHLPIADSLPFSQISGRFLAQLKVGFTPRLFLFLALALLGMVLVRRWDNLCKRLLILLTITLLGPELLQIVQLLVGRGFHPSKGNLRDFNQFAPFIAVLLGARGLHLIIQTVQGSGKFTVGWKRALPAAITLLVIVVPLLVWKDIFINLSRRAHSDNFKVNFQDSAVNKLVANTREDPPFRVATLVSNLPNIKGASGHQFLPGYVYGYGLESATGYYRMYPQRLYQYWLLVMGRVVKVNPPLIPSMIKRQYLFTPPRYWLHQENSMIYESKHELIPFSKWYNLDLLSLNNTRFILSHWPLDHPDLTLFHYPRQEIEVREQWRDIKARQMIIKVFQGDPPPHALYIYENKKVLPRAFLVGTVAEYGDSDGVLLALSKRNRDQLAKTALVEQGALTNPSLFPSKLSRSKVSIKYPRPDRVTIQTQSDGPAILVVTDNYDRYWRVWVDGVEEKIFPTYNLYRGVQISQGDHSIIMEYWPPYRLGKPQFSKIKEK